MFFGEQLSQYMIIVTQGNVRHSDRWGHKEGNGDPYRSENGISIALNHNCPPAGATARGEFALTLLPFLLPPPVFKEGRKTIHTFSNMSVMSLVLAIVRFWLILQAIKISKVAGIPLF